MARATFPGEAGTQRDRLLGSTAALFGLAAIGCVAVTSPRPAIANPQGGVVVGGDATIRTQPGRTTIDQTSDRAIINWDSFSIGPGETTRFNQPGRDAIALNRVTGATASEIAGTLEANGNVWLVNPNGVLIQRGARIDVNGLLATTADIADEDFLAGRFAFDRSSPNPRATVVNEGEISIGERGLAALVAPGVSNAGTITGQLGQVVLAGAPTFTLDFAGDGLINFVITSRGAQAPAGQAELVRNDGRIIAPGGAVRISASAAAGVVDEVINVAGVVEATAVSRQGGTIILSGGDNGRVTVAGTLDASGTQAGTTGGRVEILGDRVALVDRARVDVSGDAGGGTVLVGGDYQGKGPRPNATRTYVGADTEIAADAATRGDGGRVIVWADEATHLAASISARGGAAGGDGGFVETSGKETLQVTATARVDTSAPAGETGQWLLDPTNIRVVDTSGTENTDLETVDEFDDPDGPDGETRIDVIAISTAASDVTLQATNNVIIETEINTEVGLTIDARDGDLTSNSDITATHVDLNAGRNMSIDGNVRTPFGVGDLDIDLSAGGDLTVGDVIAGDGVTTDTVRLSAGGDLALRGEVTAHEVLLSAGGTTTQLDSAIITADELALEGGGGITLDALNDVGTLAVRAPGQSVVFRNQGSFAIGEVGSADMAGVTAGDIRVREDPDALTPTSLHIDAAVNTSGDAIFQSATDIHINAPVTVTGDGRAVFQAAEGIFVEDDVLTQGGAIHLEADSPHAADLGADGFGDVVLPSGPGLFSNGGSITLIGVSLNGGEGAFGTIEAGSGSIAVAPSQNGTPFEVDSFQLPAEVLEGLITTGVLTLGQATTAGSDGLGSGAQQLTAGSLGISADIAPNVGALRLVSRGGIHQAPEAAITVGSLALVAGGAIALNEPNDVGTLAIDAPGQSATFRDRNALTIGAVAGVSGLDAAAVDLFAGGDINFLVEIGQEAPVGCVSLTTDGDVTIDERFRADALILDIGGDFSSRNFGASAFSGEGLELGALAIERARSVEGFGTINGKSGSDAALEPTAEPGNPDYTFNGCIIGSTEPCAAGIQQPPLDEALPRLDEIAATAADRLQLRLVPDQLLIPIPSQVSAGGEESLYANDGNEELW